MADSVLVNNTKIATVDTITTVYTSPADKQGTIITAFTASNSFTTSVSYKAYIFDSTGAAVDPVLPQKIVVKDRFDSGAPIVNQVVPPGGTLRIENSAANSLSFYSTGRVQD